MHPSPDREVKHPEAEGREYAGSATISGQIAAQCRADVTSDEVAVAYQLPGQVHRGGLAHDMVDVIDNVLSLKYELWREVAKRQVNDERPQGEQGRRAKVRRRGHGRDDDKIATRE